MISDSKKLNFSLPESSRSKPDKGEAMEVAAAAGAAEGFTARTAPAARRKVHYAQLNFRVPEQVRDEFMAAYAEEAERNRAIRSAGEFLVEVLAVWKATICASPSDTRTR